MSVQTKEARVLSSGMSLNKGANSSVKFVIAIIKNNQQPSLRNFMTRRVQYTHMQQYNNNYNNIMYMYVSAYMYVPLGRRCLVGVGRWFLCTAQSPLIFARNQAGSGYYWQRTATTETERRVLVLQW